MSQLGTPAHYRANDTCKPCIIVDGANGTNGDLAQAAIVLGAVTWTAINNIPYDTYNTETEQIDMTNGTWHVVSDCAQ